MSGAVTVSSGTLPALVRLARPHQWIKNGFVLVGLLFGHAWHDALLVREVLLAFAGFCLVASGIYAFNDLRDREADRVHPRKRSRPLASGTLTPAAGAAFAVVLIAAGLGVGFSVSMQAGALMLAHQQMATEHAVAIPLRRT